ncbi:hypothetical protein [Pseudomonas syringae]|uniref:hypothetical protein n=1 Tax=Pseudomonas syringae TaxID=317 RepID=UPI00040429CE|nr:hypothetical protein [Pseudomonas syringae]
MTIAPSKQSSGTLSVTVKSKLNMGGRNTEVIIRDHTLAVLFRSNEKRSFNLMPGIYEVGALNDSGEKTEKIVTVNSDKTTGIELNLKSPESIDSHLKDEDFRTWKKDDVVYLSNAPFVLHKASEGLEVNQLGNQMIVRNTGEMHEVSTITILCNEELQKFSLPLSSGTHHRSVFCHLLADTLENSGRPRVRLSQGRTVASAMERLYEDNRILSAAEIAAASLRYLTSIVEDPTGVLIGALALFKSDQLKDKIEWLELFNKKYRWLPDGRILLACLISDELPKRSIELAIEASEQTILYRDTFSILLNFLRQWPDKKLSSRNSALRYLGGISPYVNWDSTYLSYALPQISSRYSADA